MKKTLITLLLITTALMSSFAGANTSLAKNKNNVSVLFIQIADKGMLTPMPHKPGYYQLKLTGVKEYIQFFTDRPTRVAGIYPTKKFLQKWEDGTSTTSFNKMPPNAALSAVEVRVLKNKMVNTVLQLSAPSYNAKQGTLTYTARTLNGDASPIPQRKFKNIALFIDNYCASCTGHGF
ncbi:MAG: hypothetical protein Q8M03_14625 [Legionella sp.]|nr:hypothetical protein [Legionella sp.]